VIEKFLLNFSHLNNRISNNILYIPIISGNLSKIKDWSNLGIFGKKNRNIGLGKASIKQYSDFSLPNSGTLLMPDFYWLKKNKETQSFIEKRMTEILNDSDLSLKILQSVKSLPVKILKKIEVEKSNISVLEKLRDANIYGGLLAYIEIESGQGQQNLVHPAIQSAMTLYDLFSREKLDPNLRQGILVSVQAGYSKIRYPELDISQLLENVYKIS
jgi:hypothetical protein